jgi:hypothetical protein
MSRPEPPQDVPLPWRTIVSVAVVMAISITVLWSIIDRFDSTDVPLDGRRHASFNTAAQWTHVAGGQPAGHAQPGPGPPC